MGDAGATDTKGNVQPHDLSERLTLYNTLFTKFSQEGDGIWNRFNIMLALNLAGLTGWVYVYLGKSRCAQAQTVATAISVIGLAVTLWAYYVLYRLWMWHQHWRNELYELEKHFPNGEDWVKPHHNLPEPLGPATGRMRLVAILGYTQPFLLMFAGAWLFLLWLARCRW